MKMSIKSPFLPLLLTALASILAAGVSAQTFSNLYSFTGGSDGAEPYAGLVFSNHVLYGTTYKGGDSGFGTVFSLNDNGTGFTNLYAFTGGNDGANPRGVVLSGNALYGAATGGGTNNEGTVFAVNTDGTSFKALYSFTATSLGVATNNDGANPIGTLIVSGSTLYGTTLYGGASGQGTVFKINNDGNKFTTLHSFAGSPSDGAYPFAGLTLSGNVLYGTAEEGGLYGSGYGGGTVFKMNSDATGVETLHNFAATTGGGSPNAGGALPECVFVSGGTLYGAAAAGGSSGNGVIFALNTNGTGFRVLHNFSATSSGANFDGAFPGLALILFGDTLYGTAGGGGNSGNGTVFAVNTNGTAFAVLHSFTPLDFTSVPAVNSDGANPRGLVLVGNTLFGSTRLGGSYGSGTIFSISLPVTPPQLTIACSGSNAILTWPATGFVLQSTTNLFSPSWTTNLPTPVVVNGVNTVTIPVYGAQQFFRLSQ